MTNILTVARSPPKKPPVKKHSRGLSLYHFPYALLVGCSILPTR